LGYANGIYYTVFQDSTKHEVQWTEFTKSEFLAGDWTTEPHEIQCGALNETQEDIPAEPAWGGNESWGDGIFAPPPSPFGGIPTVAPTPPPTIPPTIPPTLPPTPPPTPPPDATEDMIFVPTVTNWSYQLPTDKSWIFVTSTPTTDLASHFLTSDGLAYGRTYSWTGIETLFYQQVSGSATFTLTIHVTIDTGGGGGSI
jgi:hypothetical protein